MCLRVILPQSCHEYFMASESLAPVCYSFSFLLYKSSLVKHLFITTINVAQVHVKYTNIQTRAYKPHIAT